MAAIHNDRHPLAMKYVIPNNIEIAKKFGTLRVEDWHDRIAQEPWATSFNRGDKAAQTYAYDVIAFKQDSPDADEHDVHEVVLCYDARGERVLVHNDWIREGTVTG